jgi:lysophospholipase L1-like esterase
VAVRRSCRQLSKRRSPRLAPDTGQAPHLRGAGTTARLGLTGATTGTTRAAGLVACRAAGPAAGGRRLRGRRRPGSDADARRLPPGPGAVGQPSASSPAAAAAPRVYVAVGASETAGVGADHPRTQAWPRVLRDRALPVTRLVNLGVSGGHGPGRADRASCRGPWRDPDVVTVWLAVNDVLNLVPVPDYEADPAQPRCTPCGGAGDRGPGGQRPPAGPPPGVPDLPARLAGARGLVRAAPGTTPPAGPGPGGGVQRAGRSGGGRPRAPWPSISPARRAARVALTADDGFHPSTRGHRVIAAAFARALRNRLSRRSSAGRAARPFVRGPAATYPSAHDS